MGQHPGRELYDACWYGDFDGAYDAMEVPGASWCLGFPWFPLDRMEIR
jgi:hypothetical protein